MADVELVVDQPDVGFDADAAGFDGGEEGYSSPVVVVRVARYGKDVAGEVGRIVGGSLADLAWFAPVFENAMDAVWKDGDGETDKKGEELENTSGLSCQLFGMSAMQTVWSYSSNSKPIPSLINRRDAVLRPIVDLSQ